MLIELLKSAEHLLLASSHKIYHVMGTQKSMTIHHAKNLASLAVTTMGGNFSALRNREFLVKAISKLYHITSQPAAELVFHIGAVSGIFLPGSCRQLGWVAYPDLIGRQRLTSERFHIQTILHELYDHLKTIEIDKRSRWKRIAKLRYMSNGQISVSMVIRAMHGIMKNTGPHHSGNYHIVWGHCPGLSVAVPSNPGDAKGLFKTALRSSDPVIFLEHKMLLSSKGPVPAGRIQRCPRVEC